MFRIASSSEGEEQEEFSASPGWTGLAALVERAQAGDREAFSALVEQFEPTVHAIALRRLGNSSDAHELAQDVFLHVMTRLEQLREPERFAGWLKQMTVRMAINRMTRRLPPSSVEHTILEASEGPRDAPLDRLITREQVDRLAVAMGSLKAMDREALDAFYLQELSLVEMAVRFDVPIGTVKRRLHTARKRLRRALEQAVADPAEWLDGREAESLQHDDELVLAGAEADRW